MKINTQTKKKKVIVILVVIAIIIITGLLTFAVLEKRGFFGDKQDNSKIEKTDNTDKNRETSNYNSSDNDKEKPVNDPQQNANNQSPDIDGFITSTNISYEILTIRTQINELLPEGTCSLVLSNSQKSLTRNSNLINSATSSSCYGFDVPISELANGNWQIKITISSGQRIGIISGEVVI